MLAYSVDPDQMPHDVASDLGLHCLLMTLLQVFQVRMGKVKFLLDLLLSD